MKSNRCLIAIAIFMLFSLSKAFADSEYQRETLRGLLAVNVTIENLNPEVERHGLREEQIRTDVELKLRLAGIRVLSEEEQLNTPGKPYLYVNVNVMVRDEHYPAYVYSVEISLHQRVYLERLWDSTLCCDYSLHDIEQAAEQLGDSNLASIWWSRCQQTHFAGTWSTGTIGFTSDTDDIRKRVRDNTDVFINAWLSVNLKNRNSNGSTRIEEGG